VIGFFTVRSGRAGTASTRARIHLKQLFPRQFQRLERFPRPLEFLERRNRRLYRVLETVIENAKGVPGTGKARKAPR